MDKPVKTRINTPLRAIRRYCYECSGYSRAEIKQCVIKDCPLWPYRSGRIKVRKRIISEEHKIKLLEGLRKYRNKKKEDEVEEKE